MSKISELSDGGSLLPTDDLIVVRSGGNVRVKADTVNVDQIRLGDDEQIQLGNSQDLTLVHTPTQSIINQAGTGDLLIQKAGTTKASFTANGLEFPDSSKAIFGAGSDLQIYHDGSNSIIEDAGTGSLKIKSDGSFIDILSNSTRINNAANNDIMATFVANGAVSLYHDNSAKLATTSTGIDITGIATMDGLTNNGDVVFSKSATGVPTIKMSGFATASNPYGIINFYNEDGSQQGPNNAVQIKALAKNSDGSGGELAFHTSTGTSSEGADAVERLRIGSSGNVGIGTASAEKRLHIYDSTLANQAIRFGNPSATPYGEIQYDSSGFEHLYIRSKGTTTGFGNIVFETGSTPTEAMRIDALGDVGIGTASPDTLAHLAAGAGAAVLRLENTDTFLSDGEIVGKIEFETQDAGGAGVNAFIQGVGVSTNGATKLEFGTGGSGSPSTRMTVNSNGNVGIGTSSPQKTLDVKGTFAISNSTTSYWDFDRDDSDGSLKIADTGTERMRVDSSGNLLVSDTTANPSGDNVDSGIALHNAGLVRASTNNAAAALDLNVKGRDGDIAVFRKDGTTVGQISARSGDLVLGTGTTGLQFYDVGNAIFPLSASGNTNRDAAIDLGEGSNRFKDSYFSGDVNATNFTGVGDGDTFIGMSGSNIMRFSTGNVEAARFDSSQNFLVGTTSITTTNVGGATFKGESADRSMLRMGSTSTASGIDQVYFYNPNGIVGSIGTNASSTYYNTSSDYRLKENVVAMSGATERLKQLKPSRFNFIADADTTVDGFLAHEVQAVVPEAIAGDKDGMMDEEYEVTPAVLDDDGNVTAEAVMGTRSVPDYQGIDQSKLVPLLVATIQELEARITALES